MPPPVHSRAFSTCVRPPSRERADTQQDMVPDMGPRVAVVSDDADLLEMCAEVLRPKGYVVYAASHSGHALLACMEGEPADCLITELWMDEGSGPALARRMRRYNPNLRAIFIARTGTAAEVEEADCVLVRPFTRDDLLKRLELVEFNPAKISVPRKVPKPSAYF